MEDIDGCLALVGSKVVGANCCCTVCMQGGTTPAGAAAVLVLMAGANIVVSALKRTKRGEAGHVGLLLRRAHTNCCARLPHMSAHSAEQPCSMRCKQHALEAIAFH